MSDFTAEERLAQTISALGTQGFSTALPLWLGTVCDFDNLAVIAFHRGHGPQVLLTQARDTRVFDRIDSHYVKGAYLLDPFYTLHQTEAEQGVYRLADIAPDQFQRNEYFKSYYARTTLTDELAFFCRPALGFSITLCIGRDATTATRFTARNLAEVHRIAPVVNALMCSQWRDLKGDDALAPGDVSAGLRKRLAAQNGIGLSVRQSEVALLVLQGHSSVSIGLQLGISPQTVKVLRKQLYKRCGISSQGELYYLMAPLLENAKLA